MCVPNTHLTADETVKGDHDCGHTKDTNTLWTLWYEEEAWPPQTGLWTVHGVGSQAGVGRAASRQDGGVHCNEFKILCKKLVFYYIDRILCINTSYVLMSGLCVVLMHVSMYVRSYGNICFKTCCQDFYYTFGTGSNLLDGTPLLTK